MSLVFWLFFLDLYSNSIGFLLGKAEGWGDGDAAGMIH